MDKQLVGYLATILLWRSVVDRDRLSVGFIDGLLVMAEALGKGIDEVSEALRIYDKYKGWLFDMRYKERLSSEEVLMLAAEAVERELGITLTWGTDEIQK